MRPSAVFVACVCVLAGVCLAAAQSPLLVSTSHGPVEGAVDTFGDWSARTWRGIPYGAPTNGSMRFQAPAPPAQWTSPLPAVQAGPGCPQICSLPPGLCPPVQSEDCLYLNVFSPTSVSSPLPVMVFIHGGNFRQGEGSSSMYDATVMVNTTQIVVVTLNYRSHNTSARQTDKQTNPSIGEKRERRRL